MTELIPEFSRVINADRLSAAGSEEMLTAKPDERAALAKRFDLVDVSLLTAQLTLSPRQGGNIVVTGTVTADVVQNCVVTLEPVASHLDIPVNLIFVPGAAPADGAGSPDLEDNEEELDIYTNGKIDLGEMVAQQLGINLDPYPRKPDAALPKTEFGPKEDKPQPFAQLAALAKIGKNKDKTGD